ncbi:MAG: C4-type zinc ribbon domain-containing protein [Desulfovibrio sp.]|jgi:predicted  nucleic acid-binding Zn-ribbon protein|nr:C4-type zinc ribbon domain-containing protein [Desulfovibrio sp.]
MGEAIYLDQIKQLVELQKVDDAIFFVRQDVEKTPRDIENLEERFAKSEAQRQHLLDKIAHLEEQQKRIALEIEEDATKIKKSRNKLMQVSNTREYQAMMREMDNMEKMNYSREEEKNTLVEELESQQRALADMDAGHSSIQAELEVKKSGMEEKLAKARSELEELEKKRKEVSVGIPQAVFMRYEFIRSRLEHPVIVPVKDGVCLGCDISVPPQTFIEIQRGHQILSCPNCQRLIYWCEHFSEQEETRQLKPQIVMEPMEQTGSE